MTAFKIPAYKNTAKSLFSSLLLCSVAVFASLSAQAKDASTSQAPTKKDKPKSAFVKADIKPASKQTLKVIAARSSNIIRFHQKTSPKFGKNEASVVALEQALKIFLAQPRSQAQKNDFIQSYGSFYGETLRALFGGQWVYFNDALAIQSKNGIVTYPYASITNRLNDKKPNSIYRDMAAYKQLSQLDKAGLAKVIKQKR